jgi:hypothetical protein
MLEILITAPPVSVFRDYFSTEGRYIIETLRSTSLPKLHHLMHIMWRWSKRGRLSARQRSEKVEKSKTNLWFHKPHLYGRTRPPVDSGEHSARLMSPDVVITCSSFCFDLYWGVRSEYRTPRGRVKAFSTVPYNLCNCALHCKLWQVPQMTYIKANAFRCNILKKNCLCWAPCTGLDIFLFGSTSVPC